VGAYGGNGAVRFGATEQLVARMSEAAFAEASAAKAN
jgi:hypothetical protein